MGTPDIPVSPDENCGWSDVCLFRVFRPIRWKGSVSRVVSVRWFPKYVSLSPDADDLQQFTFLHVIFRWTIFRVFPQFWTAALTIMLFLVCLIYFIYYLYMSMLDYSIGVLTSLSKKKSQARKLSRSFWPTKWVFRFLWELFSWFDQNSIVPGSNSRRLCQGAFSQAMVSGWRPAL